MPTTTYAALRTRFDTWLRDGGNDTFTSAEKDEIMNSVFNDPYVYTLVDDSSLTTTSNTASYALPTGIQDVVELGIDLNGDGFNHVIDRGDYTVVDGHLIFDPVQKGLTIGKSLHILGKKKLTTSDSVPDYLEEYILHAAMVQAYEMLRANLGGSFLTNDMTMGDLLNGLSTHRQALAEIKRTLLNNKPVVI